MTTASATRPVPAGLAFLLVLGGVALLGNGLKAIVTSSVLVSEARFATFLGIGVDRVALLMEAIVAAMVVAVSLYPLLLRRYGASAVAVAGAAIAAAGLASFGAVALGNPAPGMREFAAYLGIALGAGALACLAPSAQVLVARWPTAAGRRALTTIWTGATPVGFLAAPQLATVLVPALGLGGYFTGFALLPLVFLLLVLLAAGMLPAPARTEAPEATLPSSLTIAFVVAVVAFETWSTLGSVSSYTAPTTLVALPVLIAALLHLIARARAERCALAAAPAAAYPRLAALFVLQMPTTGFFEAAYLFDAHSPAALVADRATLAALAQVAGTVAAGLALHRRPDAPVTTLLAFAATAVLGLAAYVAYPWLHHAAWLFASAMVVGAGTGGLTLMLCAAVVREAGRMPVLAALPSIAIVVGTEAGLEVLELVLAIARDAGLPAPGAYGALFVTQACLGLAALRLAVTAQRP